MFLVLQYYFLDVYLLKILILYEILDPNFIEPPFFAALLDSISFCLAIRFSSRCLRFSSSSLDLKGSIVIEIYGNL
jgi:hypothetical protein